MKETPIDPRKVPGKFVPEKKNTDIDADPIDNPPEKSFRKNIPRERAKIEEPEEDPRPVDLTMIWLAVILIVGAGVVPNFVPFRGWSDLVQAVMAFAGLVFCLKDPHLLRKKFPRLGVNPMILLMLVGLVLVISGLWGFAQYMLSPHG